MSANFLKITETLRHSQAARVFFFISFLSSSLTLCVFTSEFDVFENEREEMCLWFVFRVSFQLKINVKYVPNEKRLNRTHHQILRHKAHSKYKTTRRGKKKKKIRNTNQTWTFFYSFINVRKTRKEKFTLICCRHTYVHTFYAILMRLVLLGCLQKGQRTGNHRIFYLFMDYGNVTGVEIILQFTSWHQRKCQVNSISVFDVMQ